MDDTNKQNQTPADPAMPGAPVAPEPVDVPTEEPTVVVPPVETPASEPAPVEPEAPVAPVTDQGGTV